MTSYVRVGIIHDVIYDVMHYTVEKETIVTMDINNYSGNIKLRCMIVFLGSLFAGISFRAAGKISFMYCRERNKDIGCATK